MWACTCIVANKRKDREIEREIISYIDRFTSYPNSNSNKFEIKLCESIDLVSVSTNIINKKLNTAADEMVSN